MDTTATNGVPEVAPLRADATALADTARTIALVDEATFTAASAILVRIKALRTTVEALFAPHIKRAFEAHRALLDDRRRLDAPLADAEAILEAPPGDVHARGRAAARDRGAAAGRGGPGAADRPDLGRGGAARGRGLCGGSGGPSHRLRAGADHAAGRDPDTR